jgi:5-methylcytosine-specific restriction endonuclease McrA
MFQFFKDLVRVPKGKKRSKHWRSVRKTHIKLNPECALCGTTKKLEVHHILPFSRFPEFELMPNNLITLCDGGGKAGMKSCHYAMGHLASWKSFNATVVADVERWRNKVADRP